MKYQIRLVEDGGSHPAVEQLREFCTVRESLPDHLLAELDSRVAEIEALGFADPTYYFISDGYAHTADVCLLHQSGEAVARLRARESLIDKDGAIRTRLELMTIDVDGQLIVTSDDNEPASVEGIDQTCDAACGVEELWNLHRAETAEDRSAGRVVALSEAKQVALVLERHHALVRDQLVHDGSLIAVSNDDDDSGQESVAGGQEVPQGDILESHDTGVLAQVRAREANTQNWGATILIVMVSAAFFLGAGAAAWTWKEAVLLVGVLFFHELGHFAAMWIFRYRNLRMFFIPFFGAAVSGRHYNVSGWKRVLVSLMGPLPGVALGVAVGILATTFDSDLLFDGALMLLVLNGFNLLPALPLDGGWAMHAILFSRHPMLDVGFRSVAALCMLAVGFLLQGIFLFVIGVSMLAGLSAVYKTIKIAARLRDEPDWDTAEMVDDMRIPAPAVFRISNEIDQKFKGLELQRKADMILQIYETINSRPPGWLASFSLGGLYVGGLLTALVAIVLLVGAKEGVFESVALAPVNPAEIRVHPADAAPEDLTASACLIASFDNRELAEEKFDVVVSQWQAPRAALVGHTLQVPLDRNDPQQTTAWMDELNVDAAAVFVSNAEVPPAFIVLCSAPSEQAAEDLLERVICLAPLDDGASPPSPRLQVPWDPEFEITPEQHLARRTYARFLAYHQQHHVETPEEFIEFLDAASDDSNGDLGALLATRYVEACRERLNDLEMFSEEADADLSVPMVSAIRNTLTGAIDQMEAKIQAGNTTLDDHFEVSAAPAEEIAELMGRGEPSEHAYSVRELSADADGTDVTLEVSFDSPASGSLALVLWLQEQGVVEIHLGVAYGL